MFLLCVCVFPPQVLNFSSPVIVGPQQTVTPLLLLFHPNATQIHLSTTLTLHTNASTFLIPIIVYNGLLKVGYGCMRLPSSTWIFAA